MPRKRRVATQSREQIDLQKSIYQNTERANGRLDDENPTMSEREKRRNCEIRKRYREGQSPILLIKNYSISPSKFLAVVDFCPQPNEKLLKIWQTAYEESLRGGLTMSKNNDELAKYVSNYIGARNKPQTKLVQRVMTKPFSQIVSDSLRKAKSPPVKPHRDEPDLAEMIRKYGRDL